MTDEGRAIAEKLVAAYRHIAETRMKDVPIVNPVLAVACVGPEKCGHDWLAVLVTPWFMNLLLLPGEGEPWRHAQGSTVTRALPSGDYAFVAGEDELTGPTLSCSLFSPMFDFSSQDDAVTLAREVLAAALKTEDAVEPQKPFAVEKPSRRALFGLGRKSAGETA